MFGCQRMTQFVNEDGENRRKPKRHNFDAQCFAAKRIARIAEETDKKETADQTDDDIKNLRGQRVKHPSAALMQTRDVSVQVADCPRARQDNAREPRRSQRNGTLRQRAAHVGKNVLRRIAQHIFGRELFDHSHNHRQGERVMFDKKRDDEVLDVARAIQLFPKPKLARRESEVRARARIFQDEILPAAVLEFADDYAIGAGRNRLPNVQRGFERLPEIGRGGGRRGGQFALDRLPNRKRGGGICVGGGLFG
ncbi:MAG: hypothetical protein HDKAJFGB_02532 [Anaerolineae bacterium]|nr:hypothetical protein [Anaerolineae bacterium]